jgi:hypothetical protein
MPIPPADAPSHTARGEHRRTAFGLGLLIDPRIAIPGLGRSPRPATPPPTRILLDPDELDRRWRGLPTEPVRTREIRYGGTLLRAVDFAEPAGYLLWARDHGRVLISPDGAELLCEPDTANADWASIVSAQALPLAATIRGLEVLHASGVVLNGRAVLFVGPSGVGKSSLAAALVRLGGRLLSDDAVALAQSDGGLIAHAGSMTLQLRAAEDERLSYDQRAVLGHPAGSIEGKRRYLSPGAPGPAPLGSVFLLERSARRPTVEALDAVSPFALLASTFNLSVRTAARLRRQLDVVSAIAAGGLVHRLRVQPDVDATLLAAIVQEHLRAQDGPGAPERVGIQAGGHPLEL